MGTTNRPEPPRRNGPSARMILPPALKLRTPRALRLNVDTNAARSRFENCRAQIADLRTLDHEDHETHENHEKEDHSTAEIAKCADAARATCGRQRRPRDETKRASQTQTTGTAHRLCLRRSFSSRCPLRGRSHAQSFSCPSCLLSCLSWFRLCLFGRTAVEPVNSVALAKAVKSSRAGCPERCPLPEPSVLARAARAR